MCLLFATRDSLSYFKYLLPIFASQLLNSTPLMNTSGERIEEPYKWVTENCTL